jgi:hypothetical protein
MVVSLYRSITEMGPTLLRVSSSMMLGITLDWRLDRHYRFLADINGDGFPDIVAFGEDDVVVAFGNGDGTFAAPRTVISKDFTYSSGGWRIGHSPRTLADLTGDGTADIIAFRTNGGAWVALNNGDGTFREPKLSITLRIFPNVPARQRHAKC